MARLLKEHGILFQHLPRTGGTWIEHALSECGVKVSKWVKKQPVWIPTKHALLAHYFHDQMPHVRMSFAFVRHPIQYYESVYKFIARSGPDWLRSSWSWHPHATATRWFREVGGSWDDWVFMMLERDPMWYTRLVESYVGPDGGEFIDFIGRTESLVDDFLLAMKCFGYKDYVDRHRAALVSMQPENKIDMVLKWNHDLLARVTESERLVIDRFYGRNSGRRLYAQLVETQTSDLAVGRAQTDRR